MTDNSASLTYVRDTMIPQAAPPVREAGLVKWVRENLFSSWLNIILTAVSLYVLYLVIARISPWLMNSIWNAGSLTECREILAANGVPAEVGGACFAVIRDRWVQFIFGFYPADLYWRPILAFVLFFVALAPVLFAKVPRKLLAFTAIYPFLAVWLVWGGAFWSPLLVLAGFLVGYVGFTMGGRFGGPALAVIAGVVFAAIWWLFLTPMIGAALNTAVGSSRLESSMTSLTERAAALGPELTDIEAQIDALDIQIAEAVAEKDAIVARATAEVASPTTPDAISQIRAELGLAMDKLADLRSQNNLLAISRFQTQQETTEVRSLLSSITALPNLETNLPTLQVTAAEMRAALPDAVAAFATVDAATAATNDEKTALRATLTAEANALAAEKTISQTYAALGRVGLKPVESSEIGGFMLAFIIGVSGITLSLPLGILLALGRQSHLFIIQKVCVGFIEIIRGVPLIVWLFTAQLLLNYFLPKGTNFDLMLRVIIMVTLFSSAYIAEVVRGGLAALPKGQLEAADAMGLNYWQAMQLIVLPQALKISIPGIVNSFIGLFKDTTLVTFIGMYDPIGLVATARASTEWNGVYWELYIFIGLLFFMFCFSMGRYSLHLERKLRRENR
jgi:general L-amino acid transport system permease protein